MQKISIKKRPSQLSNKKPSHFHEKKRVKREQPLPGDSKIVIHVSPLSVIRSMACHPEGFVRLVMEKIYCKRFVNTSIALKTNCCYSLCALSVIFSGENRAKYIIKNIFKKFSFSKRISLSDCEWKFSIAHLFKGTILNGINKTADFPLCSKQDKQRKVQEFISSLSQRFDAYIDSCLKNCNEASLNQEKMENQFHRIFHNIDFDFNEGTFTSLEDDLKNNASKVNEKTSFIYYIDLIFPDKKGYDFFSHFHAFVIEQFYSFEQEPRYRLYQSWIEEATLWEDMQKRGHNQSVPGWTTNELNEFLGKLAAICGCKKAQKKTVRVQDCFGYISLLLPLVVFKKPILSGLTLQYWIDAINPRESQKNYVDFLNKYQHK